MEGYVSAGKWQDPQATSYMCLSAAMESSGIPIGFNIITGALYEKDTVDLYHDIMGGNMTKAEPAAQATAPASALYYPRKPEVPSIRVLQDLAQAGTDS